MGNEFDRIANGINDRISFIDFALEPLCFIQWGLIDFGKDDLRNDTNATFLI
jgi:hypothetical protein